MRYFRDKFAVHEDNDSKPIPLFNNAVKVVEAFDETVRDEYDVFDLPAVKETFEAYQLQIQDCLQECRIEWTL